MNEQYIVVDLVHNYVLDRPPSTDKFSDRITCQKVIYLAEAIGIESGGFEFNWYKKGPYSPALTRVVYDGLEQEDLSRPAYKLTNEAKLTLNALKKLVKCCPSGLSESEWLELLASMHYLYLNNSSNLRKALQKLLVLKPHFKESDAIYAYDKLENNGFLN